MDNGSKSEIRKPNSNSSHVLYIRLCANTIWEKYESPPIHLPGLVFGKNHCDSHKLIMQYYLAKKELSFGFG